MAKLLVDTNILVAHLAGDEQSPLERHDVAYSTITRAELFAGPRADEERIARLLEQFEEIAVSRDVAEAAGRIRRDVPIKLPHALIAASAMIHRRSLLTRNIRDFKRVSGLQLKQRI